MGSTPKGKSYEPKAEDNLGIAYTIANKFVPSGMAIADSEEFSDACLGLVNAEINYKPSSDNELSSFFYTCAYRQVIDGARNRRKFKLLNLNEYDGDVLDYRRESIPLDIIFEKIMSRLNSSDRNKKIFREYVFTNKKKSQIAREFSISDQMVQKIILRIAKEIQSTSRDLLDDFENNYSKRVMATMKSIEE